MKKLKLVMVAAALFASAGLWAQTPVPDPDTISNPIQQGDPTPETLPPRVDYVEDKQRIKAEEIPDAVRQTLESNTQYRGWEDADIFHDQNTDEYVIEFTQQHKPAYYRFNKEGAPIIEK